MYAYISISNILINNNGIRGIRGEKLEKRLERRVQENIEEKLNVLYEFRRRKDQRSDIPDIN